MHVSLICQTMAYIGKCADMLVIDSESDVSDD